MRFDFAAAMRRAARSTRAGKLSDPIRIMHDARLRRSLGKVVETLRQGRSAIGSFEHGAPNAEAPPLPAGAQFLARSYACASGTRGYRLYVPGSAAEGLNGLVLMLHGCKQNPDDFAAGTNMNAVAESNRLLVAYPGQTSLHNVASCWNWFDPANQRRDAGEPAILAGLTRALAAEFDIPHGRVFAAGLSAGGAMAAVLGANYPELFAAIGVHSGLPVGAANDVVSAFAAMRGESSPAAPVRPNGSNPGPRTIIFHGTADPTVHPSNADALAASAKATAANSSRSERGTAGGRAFTRKITGGRDGSAAVEVWMIEGAGHAWSGGREAGSYTDPSGPDASAEMVRFFLSRPVTPQPIR